jgi:hypothetical protein
MKRAGLVLLLFCIACAFVFAQTNSGDVTGWVDTALSFSNQAVNLARADYNANLDQIGRLIDQTNDYLFRIQNWLDQGNTLNSSNQEKFRRINANIQELQRRLDY